MSIDSPLIVCFVGITLLVSAFACGTNDNDSEGRPAIASVDARVQNNAQDDSLSEERSEVMQQYEN
jgi:hypothetical protein